MNQPFATYAYQSEADTFVRTYNLYVTDGTGRVARSICTQPGVYHVFLDKPREFVMVLKEAA